MNKTRTLWLFIAATLMLTACGGAGSKSGTTSNTAFAVKIDGKDVPMEVKSTWQMGDDYSEFSADKKTLTTGQQVFVLRNFAYDKPQNGTIIMASEKLAAPGQVMVSFYLWDEKGTTNKKTLIKAATYTSDGKESMSLGGLSVYMFGEGKDQRESVGFSGGLPDNKGEVKITSVAGDTVSGEIDITGTSSNEKKVSVKGKFTAKIYRR